MSDDEWWNDFPRRHVSLTPRLLPLLVLAAAGFLVTDDSLRKVMLVQAAMPCGIFTFLIVEMFKGEVMVSLRCSVITMLCCPLVTPLWLYLGARWLGLS